MKVDFRFVFSGFMILFMLACGTAAGTTATPEATSTPEASPVPPATDTATPRPTSTSPPTATLEPTPAPVGVPVSTDAYEVTVVNAVSLERIYPGGVYLYTPNPGYLIADIGVRVRNLSPGTTISVPWSGVYVVEQSGDSWYPLWGKFKEVESGEELDPFTLGISSTQVNGEELITFTGDAYLRVIYIVVENNPTTILFGFDQSPLIEIVLD